MKYPKPKILVFVSNNIIEVGNQYKFNIALINTYGYIRNILNQFFLMNWSNCNFKYEIQRDQIGIDILNHRSIIKYTINQYLLNLKKSQKKWFNPLIFISQTKRFMNRDPHTYKYKWSNVSKNIWNISFMSKRVILVFSYIVIFFLNKSFLCIS